MNPIRRNNAFASYTQTIITSIVISAVIFMAVVNQPEQIITQQQSVPQSNVTTDVQSFNFHVHCPLRKRTDGGFVQLMKHLNVSDTLTIGRMEANLSLRDTYAVFERVFTVDALDIKSKMLMSYCGWAKMLNESDCGNARFVCTIPGPMFRVAMGTQTAVIWVNQINGPNFDWSFAEDNCYDQSNNNSYCWQSAKLTPDQSCTFNAPTGLNSNLTKDVRISPTAAPTSPHVHGIQNRPTFDGNPLSWFNNAGDKGIGYFSASTNDYFTSFNRTISFWPGLLTSSQQASIKVNFYLNKQAPGFCFYHDHAMRATLYNNMKGAVGFYLLYDEKIQANLPKDEEEVIFIFHFHNQGDIRDYQNGSFSKITNQDYISPIGDNLFVSQNGKLYRNMTYRFRFINGHFDDFYTKISFAIFYQSQIASNGSVVYKELQPPMANISEVFTQNMHILNFSVIATDSSIFYSPVHHLTQFSLAGAQRLQLLTKFDSIPKYISNVYIVCYDDEASVPFVVKYGFKLSHIAVDNKYPNPTQYTSFNIDFTDLKIIPNTSISQYRMRALFSRPFEEVFSINLHPFFDQASSQNPKIGTVQDWFIINTASQSHPIHLHLINYQVIEEWALKATPEGCTLYELDYFRDSNISLFQIDDNAELCSLLNNLTSDIMDPLWPIFHTLYLQNQTVPTDIGLVSGKNVLEKITNTTNKTKYSVDGCPLNSVYKYICVNSSDQIYPWYKEWKDTAEMKTHIATRIRIRWTKNSYNSTQNIYPYFNFGEDELMEFPGMVYHCHILPHEENMMMRPIMMQPSDIYLALIANMSNDTGVKCYGKSWSQNQQCINKALNC